MGTEGERQVTLQQFGDAVQDACRLFQRLQLADRNSWDATFADFRDFLNRTPIVKYQFDRLLEENPDASPDELLGQADRTFRPRYVGQRRLACVYLWVLSKKARVFAAQCLMLSGSHSIDAGFQFATTQIINELWETVETKLERRLRDLREKHTSPSQSLPFQVTYIFNAQALAVAMGNGDATVNVSSGADDALISLLVTNLEKMQTALGEMREAQKDAGVEAEGDFLLLQKGLADIRTAVDGKQFDTACRQWSELSKQTVFARLSARVGQVGDWVTLGLAVSKVVEVLKG